MAIIPASSYVTIINAIKINSKIVKNTIWALKCTSKFSYRFFYSNNFLKMFRKDYYARNIPN